MNEQYPLRQDKTTFFCQESCSSSTSQEQSLAAKSSPWCVSSDSRIETIFKLKSISVVSPDAFQREEL